MVRFGVKRKLRLADKLVRELQWTPHAILVSCALLTFIFSLFAWFPQPLVETVFSRAVFPVISKTIGVFADALPIAWADAQILLGVLIIGIAIRKRQWRYVTATVAIAYLFFFWSWGLNYHRVRPSAKVPFDTAATSSDAMESLARDAAAEINRLYTSHHTPYNEASIRFEAADRVRRVIAEMDGVDWNSPEIIKTSFLLNPWFRMAGVDGLFNPLAHEPIINKGLLDFERPFIMAHELAHVRGYPNEGDANFVAILATILSENSRFQYSGWLHLWLYLRSPETDHLLEAGPREDLRQVSERLQNNRVRIVSHLQGAVLDFYLRANSVDQGIRSYAQVALLAAGTRGSWDRFR